MFILFLSSFRSFSYTPFCIHVQNPEVCEFMSKGSVHPSNSVQVFDLCRCYGSSHPRWLHPKQPTECDGSSAIFVIQGGPGSLCAATHSEAPKAPCEHEHVIFSARNKRHDMQVCIACKHADNFMHQASSALHRETQYGQVQRGKISAWIVLYCSVWRLLAIGRGSWIMCRLLCECHVSTQCQLFIGRMECIAKRA
jgi:hypothetical protein